MNNSLLDIIRGRERKQFNHIMEMINSKRYDELIDLDQYGDVNFGLTNQSNIDKVLNRLADEIIASPDLLVQMRYSNYHRTKYFFDRVISVSPQIIESFINQKVYFIGELILKAIENGYHPTTEYINSHLSSFSSYEVMSKLVDNGYRPTQELIEGFELNNAFANPNLFVKAINFGYVPTINFLSRNKLLENPNLTDIILDTIELTPQVINSNLFYGNIKAQHKIIKDHPELLSSIDSTIKKNEPFLLEAFKHGYVPSNLDNSIISSNFNLISHLVKQHPELVKYCHIYDQKEKEQLYEYALCMGYVPSIEDVRFGTFVNSSTKLMEAIILKRPETIKYIEKKYSKKNSSNSIPIEEFYDLARLALDNGYIPTLEDIKGNIRLADSFDIMKIIIEAHPEMITYIQHDTPQKEELLKIAIANGFNGRINNYYQGPENDEDYYSYYNSNKLLLTETAIIYNLEHEKVLPGEVNYPNDYSIDLYNYFIKNGYQVEKIISLFTANHEVMKEIITIHPEYINKLNPDISRRKIDELASLAISRGYEPKFEDEIFGHGLEMAKMMITKYPNYLEKVSLMDRASFISSVPCEIYDELCSLAVSNGYIPDYTMMGNGYGSITTTRYNYSYDIMKKVIPLKPSLIESCFVKDKEKYDELCRLAISHGYEIDSYALTHGANRLCTNYDMMAKYIATNPFFIMNIELTNSDEILSIIDIAINAGYNLKELKTKQLLKLFISVDEEKWSLYLDKETIESLKRTKLLQSNNSEVTKTVNPKFLSEEITSHFTPNQIEILSCYPKIQEQIIEISSNPLRANIIYELVNIYQNNLEWIPILETALKNISSSEYENLLNDIKDKELTETEKANLTYLLISDNHLDISSYEDLKNVEEIRDSYLQKLIERNTLGSLKTAYFEKVYGIDLEKALYLVKTYGTSLDTPSFQNLDEKSKEDFILLANMKKIINLNNIEVLKYYIENVNPSFVVKPDLMITYEARLRYAFTEELNKTFTKTNAEDKVTTDIAEEQDYDIYLAAGKDGKKKCRLMITSIGAYTSMSEPDDYYASWNVDKIASHGCCCSYVGEKNLGTAEVKYCCLGFTDYEMGALQLSGPYDLCSASTEDSYKIESTFSSMFLLPDDILEYTRHTHNESVWERRNISGNAKFKKQPSYIVYFVDNFSDRLTDPEAKRQWESVRKAANDFAIEVNGEKRPIPIMVVEREKIAKNQQTIINEKLEEFSRTHNPRLIQEIISDYESNYAGNREYHLNISEKYFPKHDSLSTSVVGKIIEIISDITSSKPELASACLYELEKTIKSEQSKYNNTQHGVGQSLPSFNIEEALIKINQLKEQFKMSKESILVTINNSVNNTRQFNVSDSSHLTEELISSQLTEETIIEALESKNLTSTLIMYENQITAENINSKLKVNGTRHVKNVLLYSLLIGNTVLKDEKDIELLLLSAKYHEVGRQTDAYEDFAKLSAEIAETRLKETHSQEDIAIIRTIIEFYNTPRNLSNADEYLIKLARKNGLSDDKIPKVKQLADILRDADALDRTRFINKARLNPDLLTFDISKCLVKFASSLQETYALEDLKEYHCDEAIAILLEHYTPQEVLRNIRHSTRGSKNIEDINAFIIAWSNSIIKNDEITTEESTAYGK